MKLRSFFRYTFLKKQFLVSALLIVGVYRAWAQGLGIGGTPDASAMLDVQANNKSILAPKVALSAANAAGPITNPAQGLIVYNTATAGTGENRVTPGYYYNAGTPSAPQWLRFDGTRMWFQTSASSGLNNWTSNVFTTIPGLSITFTVPKAITLCFKR